MKLHTKYFKKFLWLCEYTGLQTSQLHGFIKNIVQGGEKRLGDYVFRLLWVKRAGRDTLYGMEVYSIDENGTRRLVFKSPVLIESPHKRKGRHLSLR